MVEKVDCRSGECTYKNGYKAVWCNSCNYNNIASEELSKLKSYKRRIK